MWYIPVIIICYFLFLSLYYIVFSFFFSFIFNGYESNKQNLDPPPPCSHLFDFGTPRPANVQNFYFKPPHTPHKNNKSCNFVYSFITTCYCLNVSHIYSNTNGINYLDFLFEGLGKPFCTIQ